MTTFTDLGLDPALLKALDAEGYTTPTPIQAKAIPGVMEGRDLLGIAQTGTGKTAAFALPILHRLNADRRPAPRRGARALILSPTRELSTQIADSFRTYGKHLGFTVAVVFGGVPHRPQREALNRGVDILVATPGRLIDHLTERNVALETTEVLVLDEADQMLDMGFIRPIRQILSKLASRRQSLFFSATMPQEIGTLAGEMLRNPLTVSVTPVAKTADRVAQKVIHVEAPKKKALLAELFADPAMSRTLVFTRTKRGADRVARHLEGAGVAVAAIHGNKSQSQRERALADFKTGRIRGLVATDIAARGIDIDLVTHVVNYELPNIPESYVHRIGRTARAGAEGIAISFCDGEERAYLRDIERLTRQQIPSEDRRGDSALAAEQRQVSSGGDRRSGGERAGARSEKPQGRNADRGGDRGGHRGKPRSDDPDRRNGSAERSRNGSPWRRPEGETARGSGQQGHRDEREARRADERGGPVRAAHPNQKNESRGDRGPGRWGADGARRDVKSEGPRHDRDEARGGDRRQRSAGEGGDLSHVRFLSGGRTHGPHGSHGAPRGDGGRAHGHDSGNARRRHGGGETQGSAGCHRPSGSPHRGNRDGGHGGRRSNSR